MMGTKITRTVGRGEHRYSGENSTEFWRRVTGLPTGKDRSSLYTAGVLLQNMEETVLRWLANAETHAALRKRQKRASKKKKATRR